MKESIKEYLYFTKSERIGAITLVLMFMAVIFAYINFANQPQTVDPMLVLQQEMAALKLELKRAQISPSQPSDPSSKKQQTAQRTTPYPNYKRKARYQAYQKPKNGKPYTQKTSSKPTPTHQPYTKKQDATNSMNRNPVTPKALTVGEAASSLPDFTKTAAHQNRKSTARPVRKPLKVDINKATAETFQRLYGIGPAYSARIVKFREALGGFSDIKQVSEVYGLPDSTFQAVRPNLEISPAILHKLNINTASKDELSFHPYLHWKQAKIIIAYREMHGPFGSLEDLKKIHGLEADLIQKMKPYLQFDKT